MSEIKGPKSHLPFDLLFKNCNDIIFATDGKDVLYASEKLYNLSVKKKIAVSYSIENFLTDLSLPTFNELIHEINSSSDTKNLCYISINKQQYEIKYSLIPQEENPYYIFTLKPFVNEHNFAKELDKHFSEVFPFVLLEIDLQGKVLKFNHQLHKHFYYSEEDISTGLYLEQMLTPGSRPIIISMLKNFSKFENDQRIELKFKKKFGESFPGQLYYKPIIEKKQMVGLSCLILNISENKQIEYKYKRNQQRLRKVLDLVPHMIFLKDINGNILIANKACAEFYNTTAKQLVYSKISDFHRSKAEFEEILAEDREVISKKAKSYQKTVLRTDLNNNPHIFESTKIPYTEPQTKEVHSLGILVDITEKKRVEKEIEETKEKYRLLVERGTDGILIIQTQKIVFANNQAASIFGQPLNDVINQPLERFIKKSHLKRAIANYTKNAQNKNLSNYYEVKISKNKSEYTYVEATISTINYEGKKSRLVFIRDITNRKLAEKKSERDKNMLKQAQKIANLGSWEWDV